MVKEDFVLRKLTIIVFITASEYFAIRFAETPYNETFQNYFSTYFTIANLTTYALVLSIQNKVKK
jgi:equilibrative nucleoside transporter 1/2/3